MEQELSTSTIKMYALLLDKVVIAPFVCEESELLENQKKYPQYEFIEMTLENSPAQVGEIWKGK